MHWLEMLATISGSVIASSGLWAYIQQRGNSETAESEALRGIMHDRILDKASIYIDRGWISKDEYEDFIKYLYEPYEKLGGNGMANKMRAEVDKLPLRNQSILDMAKSKSIHGKDE